VRVVLTSAPAADAERISRTIVEEQLAACVQCQAVTSLYRWKGEVVAEPESVLWIKVSAIGVSALTERIQALHPYELPEIIVLPVDAELSSSAYIEWVQKNSSAS
jgi:periplasmic divalent cation tolerance protein